MSSCEEEKTNIDPNYVADPSKRRLLKNLSILTAAVLATPLFPACGRIITTPKPIESTPTPTLEPTPTPTPEVEDLTLVEALLQSFVDEVPARRAERAKNDPDFYRRVDQKLNEGRVNFLLFGYGDDYEPPYDKLFIASPSIISVDYQSGSIDIVSLTHDIRDPLIEKVLGIQKQKGSAQRLDQSLLNKKAVEKVGQFKLPQLSLESATGLSVDYQLHAPDDAIGRFIDAIGGVEVNFPLRVPLQAYWYEGKKYEEKGWVIEPGLRRMSGREVVGGIKAIPQLGPHDKGYNPEMGQNFRKAWVIKGLQKMLTENLNDNGLKLKIAAFLFGEVLKGQTDYDFNPTQLVVNNLRGKSKKNESHPSLKNLAMRKTIYIVDNGNSPDKDMPVQWINSRNRPDEEQVYQENFGYEMPIGTDPYGDLVSYWGPVRAFVRKRLSPR